MDIQMADMAVHIEETLSADGLAALEDKVREQEGVISVLLKPQRPHLMVVEYDPLSASTAAILKRVTDEGLHADMIGT